MTADARLSSSLRGARRCERTVRALRALLAWWGGASLVVCAMLLVDLAQALPWFIRLAGSAVCVLIFIVGACSALWVIVRPPTRDESLRLLECVECANGIAPSVLRAAWEFGDGVSADAMERSLRDRSLARAEASLASLAPVRLGVERGGLSRRSLPLLVGVLVLALFAAVDHEAFSATGVRLLDPLGDHPAVSPTRVHCALEDEVVLVGDEARVLVTCAGEMPGDAWLRVGDATIALERLDEEGARWGAGVGPVLGTLSVRAVTGTGYSRALTIEPVALARVTRARVTVLPAEHARGLAPDREASEPVVAIEGSTLRVELITSIESDAVQLEDGRMVGEAQGRRMVVERSAAGAGREEEWSFTPVTALGVGPEAWRLRVRTLEDRPARVGFVGERVRDGVVTLREGERAVVGVEAIDDLALDPAGILVEGAGVVRTDRVDHALSRVIVGLVGGVAGETMTVTARARDTRPGVEWSEARLVVRTIDEATARDEALGALTIDDLATPSEEVTAVLEDVAAGRAPVEEALGALEALGGRETLTGFEEAARERALALAARAGEDAERAALEAARTLRRPAETLRLANALREEAETLGLVIDAQRTIADRATGGEELATLAPAQSGNALALEASLQRLAALADRALAPTMDTEALARHREAIGMLRERVMASVEDLGVRHPDDDRVAALRDGVLTELFFATTPLLDGGASALTLDRAATRAELAVAPLVAMADGEVERSLALLLEHVRGIGEQAGVPLAQAGTSGTLIVRAARASGAPRVLAEAASAMATDEARGADLAVSGAELLEALRRDAEERTAGSGADSPLSLSAGAQEAGAASSSPSGEGEGTSETVDALRQLSENRARERAGGESDSVGSSARVGGAGEGGGTSVGGASVEGTPRDDDNGNAAPGRAGGDVRWVERETTPLTPAEAERLARVPAAYRELVAAYLREAARRGGGRIE